MTLSYVYDEKNPRIREGKTLRIRTCCPLSRRIQPIGKPIRNSAQASRYSGVGAFLHHYISNTWNYSYNQIPEEAETFRMERRARQDLQKKFQTAFRVMLMKIARTLNHFLIYPISIYARGINNGYS